MKPRFRRFKAVLDLDTPLDTKIVESVGLLVCCCERLAEAVKLKFSDPTCRP